MMTRPGTASAICMNILTRTGVLPVRIARAFPKICRSISSSDTTKQQQLTQAVRGEIQLHKDFSHPLTLTVYASAIQMFLSQSMTWEVMGLCLTDK